MLIKGLDNHFTDPLAGSHDIGRVYRFICRNHNKTLRSVHGCRIGGLPGSENIILYSFIRTCLHQWNMLVRCCMIDNFRLIMVKNPVHPVRITNRCNQHFQIQIRKMGFQLLLHVINAVLINIQHDEQ